MNYKKFILVLSIFTPTLYAESDQKLLSEIKQLQQQTQNLQSQLNKLQKRLVTQRHIPATSAKEKQIKQKQIKQVVQPSTSAKKTAKTAKTAKAVTQYHPTAVIVHTPELHPESIGFYPTALVAEDRVVTYIAGTPVVSSPYLGDRPAFDGSDYIVNISSINRDVRLMQQRRRLYRAYESIGYPAPEMPIISLSGKSEPVAVINDPFRGNFNGDFTLGTSEVDVAAALNRNVEAYIAIAYDESPPAVGPRIANSAFNLNMGFVNVGNLDRTPFYFTGGQLYVPFGRYSSAMISAPLAKSLARTKTRPFIFGYKSQDNSGPFAAVYAYRSDTTLGKSGVGGANLGYIFEYCDLTGEIGTSYISSIADSGGMQSTGSYVGTTFGGFGSITNGNEEVRKTQAVDVYGNFGYDRYNFSAEWVGTTQRFRAQDLSFNGEGARPQAAQVEFGMTFRAFDRPSSIGIGYQWTKSALALNLAKKRILGVFNISIWKDTVESLEYRHEMDYNIYQYANGAAPFGLVNQTTFGTGGSADTVSAQIGVYF